MRRDWIVFIAASPFNGAASGRRLGRRPGFRLGRRVGRPRGRARRGRTARAAATAAAHRRRCGLRHRRAALRAAGGVALDLHPRSRDGTRAADNSAAGADRVQTATAVRSAASWPARSVAAGRVVAPMVPVRSGDGVVRIALPVSPGRWRVGAGRVVATVPGPQSCLLRGRTRRRPRRGARGRPSDIAPRPDPGARRCRRQGRVGAVTATATVARTVRRSPRRSRPR